MTDSNATYTRSVVCDLPDYPSQTVKFELLSFFAAAGTESFPKLEYTLTLDANGAGTQVLPVPDNTGVGSWLWRVTLPDGEPYKVTLAYSASSIQLTAWLASALSTETPNSLTDTFVLKAGDTMTGPLAFSGTDHAGIKLLSLTTVERDALTPAEGMVIYNETDSVVQVYQGAAWVDYGSGGGAVSSVFGRTGAVVAAISDYDANQVDVTPAGNIASTDVQGALEELDGDIQSVAGSIPFSFTALNDTPSSISQNTLMWGGPIGSALVEKTAAESLTLLGAQASSAKLSAIAALTWAADSIIMLTGTATAAVQALASHVVTFLQSASAADARTAIGAGTGDGDVTAGAVITDNAIVRGDGGAKGVQTSPVTIDDTTGKTSFPESLTEKISLYGNRTGSSMFGLSVESSRTIVHGATGGITLRSNNGRNVVDIFSAVGYFALKGFASVSATPQTVIPNGTGDVTAVLSGTFTVQDSAGNVAGGVITAIAPSGTFNLYDDGGTNTCQLQVAADGSVVVVRTAGARTYTVNLNLNWI